MTLSISPSIGVSRLGNSDQAICLSPTEIGGLPYDSDEYGTPQGPITSFRDETGCIKRQGQLFNIYDEDGEITLDRADIVSIEWTVHLANKKAAWYQYSELDGNLLFGSQNSYAAHNVPFRNESAENRQTLIIDPGPRTVSGPQQQVGFDRDNVPVGYPAQYPPSTVSYGVPVTTLGELRTDPSGRLVVLGGFGKAGGNEPLTSYGGSDTWHDDIADGPVYCTVTYEDKPQQTANAWVIVGSPDFAPEIVNISALSDTMFDVGVRHFDLVPDMYQNGQWNEQYEVNFGRDIAPIIARISRYQWVANVQSMTAFFANTFDYTDRSRRNRANRKAYFSYFREPNDIPASRPPEQQPQQQLFQNAETHNFPMMPLNSGSNSVSNTNVTKFLSLDQTQYFMLGQWAKGRFNTDPAPPSYVDPRNAASVGNCVGLPMCPGIEVTWSMQNPQIYSQPYVISHYQDENYYHEHGLTPSRDECEGGGCEPGDLTKRMACPWQADFFQCTVQYINFTDPTVNKIDDKPLPPTYYAYWWPPQSPWDVLTGEVTAGGQQHGHLPAGQQMNYARGINSFVQMVEYWHALGFIRDQNPSGRGFPYMVETERLNEVFSFEEVPIGQITGNDQDNETTIPVFFIPQPPEIASKSERAARLVNRLEQDAFKKIEVAIEGLGLPRSGTRSRR